MISECFYCLHDRVWISWNVSLSVSYSIFRLSNILLKKKIGFCQFFDFGYSFLLILTYYCNGFIVAQQTFVGLEDVLKTSLRHVLKMSWRPILKTSRRHDGGKQNTYWGYLYLINLNLYLTNLYFRRQYLTILRPIQNALIRI